MSPLAAGLALLVLTGCGSTPSSSPAPAAVTGRAESSTWIKPYPETTCGDLEERMSPRQRLVMVAELLTGLRSKDGDHTVPADVVVRGFDAAMDNSCRGVPARYGVTDVAEGVYLTQRSHWRP